MAEHRKYDQLRSQEVPGKKEFVTVCYSQNGLQEMTMYLFLLYPIALSGIQLFLHYYYYYYLHYASLTYGTKAGLTSR